MVYEMKLNEAPFEKIRSGSKTVELRLFDEKRRRLEIGDDIIFTRLPDERERIVVKVKALRRFASFEELFDVISPEMCGNDAGTLKEEAALGMRKYYSEEQEKKYGVVGIGVSVIDLEDALARQEQKKDSGV